MYLGALIAGRYRVVKGPLEGGTNELWVAVDEGLELGREVVLKRLRGDGAATLARLKAEARAQAAFSHPHVVTLFSVERHETDTDVTWWLVLEYFPRGSLQKLGKIPARRAAGIGAQIADALAALHAKGLVHCDVKPGNIVMAEERKTAKLTDFGAAYRMPDRETITPNGGISHTPAYAAPEVTKGMPQTASDVFSLGVTILALIYGEPIRTVPPPVGSGHRDPFIGVEPLRDLLAVMLDPEPAHRPGADEVHQRLTELAGAARPQAPTSIDPPVTRPDPPGPPPVPDKPNEPGKRGLWAVLSRRSRSIAMGTVVVVVAGASYGTLSLLRGHGKHPPVGKPPNPRIDLHTADPCALIDPRPLARFGRTEVDDDGGNFNRCDVIVHSRKHGDLDVEVQFINGPRPEQTSSVKTMGPIRVVTEPASGTECERTVLLPAPNSGTNAIVSVDGEASAPLCTMADTATSTAVGVLRKGPIRQRSLPPRSLAWQNACALLDGKALNIVPGIDAGRPTAETPWDCKWQSTTEDLQVKLRFDRDQPLTGADGRVMWLNGYQTVITPHGDEADTCVARVVYRDYRGGDQQQMVEMLYLTVEGKPSVTRLCSLATGLAGPAATALPRT
ncbi:serine/threonine protein kinase [Actinoallomurus spadix]|uniref:non-specific serine/threonine protein kinase n=1 Tax=Actinoallomurus spadix TaxID=79912 RepID=A0ABN0XR53_9ACTN|nr:serine/threonine-protein kinase [Actinoallomurus spadix]MCO5991460.1 serine/threonine protein kinase [Actinoallomurus spadix]